MEKKHAFYDESGNLSLGYSALHTNIHACIHPLLSFLKEGFSKIIAKNIIANKMEYSKYITSGLVKLPKS